MFLQKRRISFIGRWLYETRYGVDGDYVCWVECSAQQEAGAVLEGDGYGGEGAGVAVGEMFREGCHEECFVFDLDLLANVFKSSLKGYSRRH